MVPSPFAKPSALQVGFLSIFLFLCFSLCLLVVCFVGMGLAPRTLMPGKPSATEPHPQSSFLLYCHRSSKLTNKIASISSPWSGAPRVHVGWDD